MKEYKTAEIVRVASGPSVWRLIIWKHTPITRRAHMHDQDHNCIIKDIEEHTASIEDVFETDLKSYHILRKMARDRGFEAPTFIYVQRMLRKALGPHDSDEGPTVGHQLVFLWNQLDDHRENTHSLKIELSISGTDGQGRKILLRNHRTMDERQIG